MVPSSCKEKRRCALLPAGLYRGRALAQAESSRLGLRLLLLLLGLALALSGSLLLDVLVIHSHRLVNLELQRVAVIDTARFG